MTDEIDKKNLDRLHTTISKEGKEWLLGYMRETNSRSFGEAIENLILKEKSRDNNQLLGDILAEEIANRVIKELKEPIDILRRRTSYSDRQTKVITEVLNHMINTLKLDRTDDNVVLTTTAKTNVLSVAENRIKEQLTHFAQQAATKRNAIEQKALEEGDK
ncbi:hypothetical protein [Enterococcus sp. LJL90]